MDTRHSTWTRIGGWIAAAMICASGHAQQTDTPAHRPPSWDMAQDTVIAGIAYQADKDTVRNDSITPTGGTGNATKRHKRDWATWKPNPKRAMWLALVMPGAGQIYNRKYWKLPIIYGGFVGCAYAMRWNNMMYRDYSQAYLDIMDNDPQTQSYNQFLHLGSRITPENMARWQDIFQRRKNLYRRWRDLSFFVMLGVYALSVIDAYVDASLSEFDISPDLSLHIAPAVIHGRTERNLFRNTAIGLQCSLNF